MMMKHDPIDPGQTPAAERPVWPAPKPWVGDRMTCPAVTVERSEPIAHAVRLMQTGRVHHLPVVDRDQRLLGLVTADDLIQALLAAGVEDPATAPPSLVVGSVMHREAVCVAPYCAMAEAERLMHDHKLSALPVVQAGYVVGILTVHDLEPPVAA